nr:unnamed protein product [Digitaria exilis]
MDSTFALPLHRQLRRVRRPSGNWAQVALPSMEAALTPAALPESGPPLAAPASGIERIHQFDAPPARRRINLAATRSGGNLQPRNRTMHAT